MLEITAYVIVPAIAFFAAWGLSGIYGLRDGRQLISMIIVVLLAGTLGQRAGYDWVTKVTTPDADIAFRSFALGMLGIVAGCVLDWMGRQRQKMHRS